MIQVSKSHPGDLWGGRSRLLKHEELLLRSILCKEVKKQLLEVSSYYHLNFVIVCIESPFFSF